jgi:hypothetical protein
MTLDNIIANTDSLSPHNSVKIKVFVDVDPVGFFSMPCLCFHQDFLCRAKFLNPNPSTCRPCRLCRTDRAHRNWFLLFQNNLKKVKISFYKFKIWLLARAVVTVLCRVDDYWNRHVSPGQSCTDQHVKSWFLPVSNPLQLLIGVDFDLLHDRAVVAVFPLSCFR